MMDEMGMVEYAPGEPRGTHWHPHRGFETVTWLRAGTFLHQDSHGGGGRIEAGDTQWMTAGAGILHIETPPEELVVSGGLFHGIQLWVNLPPHLKFAPPRYQDIPGERVTEWVSLDGGGRVKVIAGELYGVKGPGVTHTPITLANVVIQPGHELTLPWNTAHNALVYVLNGVGTVGGKGAVVGNGELAVLGAGEQLVLRAAKTQPGSSDGLDVLVLGGKPLKAPVHQYGPFVMNTQAQLREAVEDYQAGRFGVIPPGALMPHYVEGQRV